MTGDPETPALPAYLSTTGQTARLKPQQFSLRVAEDWDGDSAGPERHPLTIRVPQVPGPNDPLEERRTGRTVRAEWALWGKEARDLEYSLLRCSKGPFGPADFLGIITRYAPGTKEALPQYTVCWIPGGNGGEGYLAVAIHELADSRPGSDDGRARAANGREIEYIRLFCVSYAEMARHQVSYTELVDSVRDHQLPAGRTDPVAVELLDPEPARLQSTDYRLAQNVAALLLTTCPVCVLGANQATAEGRLQFIEQVMSLLPYGLRSQMSASTWASATAKRLRLRLYFASAERDDSATVNVTWGQPKRFDFSGPESTSLRHYVNWLERGGVSATVELAGQSEPVRFDPDEIRAMIADLPHGNRPVTDVLEELAGGLQHRQQPVISAAVKRLRQRLIRPLSQEDVDRYRKKIEQLGLLKAHPGVHHKTGESVYRTLLELTVGSRISYSSFSWVEDCAGGPPTGALGREMLKLQFVSFVPWLLTSRAATQLSDQELMAHLSEQGRDPAEQLDRLCARLAAMRSRHQVVALDFAVRYLRTYGTEASADLKRLGFLTGPLELVFRGDREAQCSRLRDILTFLYKTPFTREQADELLARPEVVRTAALEHAVAGLTERPDRWPITAFPSREHVTATFGHVSGAWRHARSAKLTGRGTTVVIGLVMIVVLMIIIFVALLVKRVDADDVVTPAPSVYATSATPVLPTNPGSGNYPGYNGYPGSGGPGSGGYPGHHHRQG